MHACRHVARNSLWAGVGKRLVTIPADGLYSVAGCLPALSIGGVQLRHFHVLAHPSHVQACPGSSTLPVIGCRLSREIGRAGCRFSKRMRLMANQARHDPAVSLVAECLRGQSRRVAFEEGGMAVQALRREGSLSCLRGQDEVAVSGRMPACQPAGVFALVTPLALCQHRFNVHLGKANVIGLSSQVGDDSPRVVCQARPAVTLLAGQMSMRRPCPEAVGRPHLMAAAAGTLHDRVTTECGEAQDGNQYGERCEVPKLFHSHAPFLAA